MAINITTLTREWIQFLKNNQIVSTNSDPKTGKLKYNRKPNVQELIRFLSLKTDFDEEDIRRAIKTVMSKKGVGIHPEEPKTLGATPPETSQQRQLPGPKSDKVSTWQHDELTPGKRQAPKTPMPPQDKTRKYSNDDAEDVEFRDAPLGPGEPPALTHKRRPRFKYRNKDGLNEDFYDRQGAELDENDIKEIFRILLSPAPAMAEPTEEPGPSDEEKIAKKQEYMRKLKQMIREVMTPQQRKALWRALGENLTESIINRADAEEIFKDAAYLRSKPTGLGKIFKGLRKDTVSVEDLRQVWANGLEGDGSDGYSNDTNDIKRILLKFGFGEKEINKVFAQVFNTDDGDYDEITDAPAGSPAVQKVADLAKEYGLSKQLRAFLEQEFSDELGLDKRKAMSEDVRQIFTFMVQEERTELARLIHEQEQRQLGRTRK
jgi:hypothetical protein